MKKFLAVLIAVVMCVTFVSSKTYAKQSNIRTSNLNVQVMDAEGLLKSTESTSNTTWIETIGGNYDDWARDVQQTPDGGYIVCGHSESSFAHNSILIARLDSDGNVVWSKVYKTQYYSDAYAIQRTYDGSYIIAGKTYSSNGYIFTITKIDPDGNLKWCSSISGISYYSKPYIQQTSDHGYIISGTTDSFGAGKEDFIIVKLDSSGTFQWAKTFGGGNNDENYSVWQTKDDGYILTGLTRSFGATNNNFLIIKIDKNGEEQWSKMYDEDHATYGKFAYQTSDGSYIVVGSNYSDIIIMKLNPSGSIVWKKTFKEGNCDVYSFQPTSDGGYIISGDVNSYSFGTKYSDAFLLKVNSNGEFQWEKIFNGDQKDCAYSVKQLSNGGYIVAGYTASFGAGYKDYLIMKLGQDASVCDTCGYYIKDITPSIITPGITMGDVPVIEKSVTPSVGSLSINISDVTLDKTVICQGEIVAPPTPPTNLQATASSTSITLTWQPSTQGTYPIQGYAIYRGTTPGGEDITPIKTVSATTYTDTDITAGTTYYYYVKTFDNKNHYSSPSNEAHATVTCNYPPVTISITPGKFNLIALPFPTPMLVSVLNNSNGGHILMIYTFDWTHHWTVINPSDFATTYLEPGRGYWVKFDDNAPNTFTFPAP